MCKFQCLIGLQGEANRRRNGGWGGRLMQEVQRQHASEEASPRRQGSLLWNLCPETAQKPSGQHEDFRTDA